MLERAETQEAIGLNRSRLHSTRPVQQANQSSRIITQNERGPDFCGEAEIHPPYFTGQRRLANAHSGGYALRMTTTVDAIYENGILVLNRPLSMPEKSRVRVTIESTDIEREAWLKLSEDSLAKVWDNDADDVFNELLQK